MKPKKLFDILLILFFLVTIFSPTLGLVLGVTSQVDNNEYRRLVEPPKLSFESFSNFPKSYTTFFNDNFGFRNLMIKQYGFLKLNYLKTDPDFYRIHGTDGWVFVNTVPRNALKEWYQEIKFSQEELFKITQQLVLEQKRLEELNIPYIIVFVPDKEVIYSEYFPYPNHITTDHKLNQLIDHLKKRSNLEIVDLREYIIESKGGLPMWYRTDSHWNNYGAFIAYEQIMRRFSTYRVDISWPKSDDFIIKPEYYELWTGDLGPYFKWWERKPDVGVKFTLKSEKIFSNLKAVVVHGDSYSHTTRFARRQEIEKQFPKLKSIFGLLFKNPDGKEDLQPITKIEDLVPIIRENIPDKSTQERLIAYLINNRVLEEELVGINYFLQMSFHKVIEADYHTPIDFDQIESEKPELVIREVVQRYLDNWVLLNK